MPESLWPVERAATQASLCHPRSSCLSEFLSYYVTAGVRDPAAVCVLLKTPHSDAQTQVRHRLQGSAGREQVGLKAETPTLTDMRKIHFYHFHFHKTKNTDPPAVRMCGISRWSPTSAAFKFTDGVSDICKGVQYSHSFFSKVYWYFMKNDVRIYQIPPPILSSGSCDRLSLVVATM